ASPSLTGGLRALAERTLALPGCVAEWRSRRKASRDDISFAGMVAGLAAGLCFAAVWWFPPGARAFWLLGAVLVQMRLLANLFDGMVAVGRGIASPLGELYNEVPDRVSDTAILLGLGVAAGGNWGLGLAAALAAMATAYIRAV